MNVSKNPKIKNKLKYEASHFLAKLPFWPPYLDTSFAVPVILVPVPLLYTNCPPPEDDFLLLPPLAFFVTVLVETVTARFWQAPFTNEYPFGQVAFKDAGLAVRKVDVPVLTFTPTHFPATATWPTPQTTPEFTVLPPPVALFEDVFKPVLNDEFGVPFTPNELLVLDPTEKLVTFPALPTGSPIHALTVGFHAFTDIMHLL